MTNERMNKVLAELKEYGQMKKELDNQIKALQDECKLYMTEHELSEFCSMFYVLGILLFIL